MKTKICTRCKEEKQIVNFHKHVISKDGYRHECKECRKLPPRYKSNKDRFLEKVNKDGPYVKRLKSKCWVWTAAKMGKPPLFHYGQFSLDGKLDKAHRVSWRLFVGEIPKYQMVLHHCDNPECVNPRHLYIGNHQDNANDRIKRNRSRKGEKSPVSKLTDKQVLAIRKIHKVNNFSHQKIADQFNVCRETITQIINRRIWKHL